jgi:hypothetical protein
VEQWPQAKRAATYHAGEMLNTDAESADTARIDQQIAIARSYHASICRLTPSRAQKRVSGDGP